MERKIKKLEHCQTEVLVTFGKEEFEAEKTKAFNKLKQNVTVKGFRKGKAPDNLLKEKVDPAKILEDAVNALVPVGLTAIIKEDKVAPFLQPEIVITDVKEDSVTVKYVITTAPEIELGQYKDLKIGKEEPKVEDKEIDDEIIKLQGDNATLVVKDGAAADGDIAIIDFKGFVDGKEFQGGAADNYELTLGSHSFIPGFEEQIVGHKADDEFDVNVTFPEQYTPELAGKDARFAIKLHEVKSKSLPELNDEFVLSLDNGSKTVAELKDATKARLLEEKSRSARNAYVDKVLDEIIKNSKIDIAEAFVVNEANRRKQEMEQQMAQSGFTLEQYLNIVGQTEEAFEAKLMEESRRNVTAFVILQEVAKKEEIVVGDKELEFEYSKMAEMYKMKIEDVKKAIEPQKEQFKNQIQLSQAEELLFTKNN